MAIENNFFLSGTPTVNPLTEEDKQTLLEMLRNNEQHNDLINRCEDCGLDVTEKRARANMHREVARKVLFRFFGIPMPETEMHHK